LEAFADECARGFERLLVVGEERRLVADDFELDEVCLQSLAREPRRTHGLLGRVTAGRVREDDERRVEVIEERFGLAVERDAADGDRHHLGARSAVRRLHLLEAAILPRAHDQARRERAPGDLEGLSACYDCR